MVVLLDPGKQHNGLSWLTRNLALTTSTRSSQDTLCGFAKGSNTRWEWIGIDGKDPSHSSFQAIDLTVSLLKPAVVDSLHHLKNKVFGLRVNKKGSFKKRQSLIPNLAPNLTSMLIYVANAQPHHQLPPIEHPALVA